MQPLENPLDLLHHGYGDGTGIGMNGVAGQEGERWAIYTLQRSDDLQFLLYAY